MSISELSGGVVVLTGASSGIGREMAQQLADSGARLVLAARRRERLEQVAAECRRRGASTSVIPTDVAVETECRELIEGAIREQGRIDTLILNAGISMVARLDELPSAAPLERLMRVNYLGAAWCTYHALPQLRKSGGRIVAVASLTALVGVPTRTGYAASKHAMAGFFDSLRIEMAGSGVSITVAYPGFVVSEIRDTAIRGDDASGAYAVEPERMMPTATCARLILEAAAGRRREIVMTARGKLARWLGLLAPSLTDRLARRAIRSGR